MNSDLEGLVRLQRAETDLRRVEADLAEVPKERAALDDRLASERARLDAAREALGECQKSRRQLEGDLQDLETKRSRYKAQLMEVKTNKEYTAMLHEIEGVEREIRGREDQVLAEMERGEAPTAEIKAEEAEFKSMEIRHRGDGKALEEREEALTRDTARLTAERDAIAEAIAPEVRDLFQRIARLRGVAVAEARDGMCQLCHVKLRPQMFLELKRNDKVEQCPSCSRIIYYEPPVPVEAPQP
jgi:uncharacterized protein